MFLWPIQDKYEACSQKKKDKNEAKKNHNMICINISCVISTII